ncbi:hypothetical protein GJW-30_1_02914 [Variibacter gotjawalensis]|uniref:Uncharacterized protein n=1 Tax=Variibacter gotjawalensis TaxID=1333996 RepID=A0A0S3PWU3_9BRAD|nr:hypothetical protein [Variibacter gotjawalensis]NIK46203.1 hypothetical protein [Variibacter gotjawalensis]RZS48120.1 hypothetical protein EV661_0517 [Variibacter gotjawalensis]BAT60377.1 hypothetical protein GJW-30_1_02914 [Variibacter gotjawalensis]
MAPKRPRKEKTSSVSPTGERPATQQQVLQKQGDAKPLESFEDAADRGSDDAKLLVKDQPAREEQI